MSYSPQSFASRSFLVAFHQSHLELAFLDCTTCRKACDESLDENLAAADENYSVVESSCLGEASTSPEAENPCLKLPLLNYILLKKITNTTAKISIP